MTIHNRRHQVKCSTNSLGLNNYQGSGYPKYLDKLAVRDARRQDIKEKSLVTAVILASVLLSVGIEWLVSILY